MLFSNAHLHWCSAFDIQPKIKIIFNDIERKVYHYWLQVVKFLRLWTSKIFLEIKIKWERKLDTELQVN